MSTKPDNSFPSWLAQDDRTADRIGVSWQGTISALKFDAETCSIQDMTHLGCRVALAHAVSVGTYVSIGVAHIAGLEGWVAWNRGCEIGVDFSHPLPADVLNELVRRNEDAAPH